MVEHSPPQKNDEEDPLLKVVSDAGDGRGREVSSPPRWNVTCAPRKSFLGRWPELFSACWMAGMLLGVFVLIIYGLGSLGVIRRPPLFVMNFNDSRSTNEVHYHYIIEEGIDVPFDQLSKYLIFMTTEYPGLHYNVIFLINNIKGYRTITPQCKRDAQMRDLRLFRNYHLKYHNISVTVITLTKYLAETPWRFKWRKINMSFLAFYLRVYTVWKKGGIGMQLGTYSDLPTLRLIESPAVDTILRKYSNNGGSPEEYADAPNKIYNDEKNEFLSLFYSMVHQILNESRFLFNRSLTSPEDRIKNDLPKPCLRSHRTKRDLSEDSNTTLDVLKNKVKTEDEPLNFTQERVPITNSNENNTLENGKVDFWMNDTGIISNTSTEFKSDNTSELEVRIPFRNDSTSPHQILILYDFSILSEAIGPPYISSGIVQPSNIPMSNENSEEADQREQALTVSNKSKRNSNYTLTIALNGSFIAATTKNHPFLGHIISMACKRMAPRFAIQDAVFTQCSSISSDKAYCSNIYLI